MRVFVRCEIDVAMGIGTSVVKKMSEGMVFCDGYTARRDVCCVYENGRKNKRTCDGYYENN